MNIEPVNAAGVKVSARDFGKYGRVMFRGLESGNSLTASISGDRLTVTFKKPIAADIAAIKNRLRKYILTARYETQKKIIITLNNEGYAVRRFLGSGMAGLDIKITKASKASTKSRKNKKTSGKSAAVKFNPDASSGSTVGNGNSSLVRVRKVIKNPSKRQIGNARFQWMHKNALRGKPLYENREKPEEVADKKSVAGKDGEAKEGEVVEPDSPNIRLVLSGITPPLYKPMRPKRENEKKKQEEEEKKRLEEEKKKKEEEERKRLEEEEKEKVNDVDISNINRKNKGNYSVDGILRVQREVTKDSIKIIFPWEDNISAAVFSRGQTVWMIFERPYHLELKKLAKSRFISKLKQVFHPRFTILQVRLDDEYKIVTGETKQPDQGSKDPDLLLIKTNKLGSKWVVEIIKTADNPARPFPLVNPVPIKFELYEDGSRMFMPIIRFTDALELNDEVAGDTLVVAPILSNSTGNPMVRQFVDFKSLQTFQGLVIQKNADYLKHKAFKDGLEIVSEKELNVDESIYIKDVGEGDVQRARKNLFKLKGNIISRPLADNSVFPFANAIEVMKNMKFEDEENEKDSDKEDESSEEKEGDIPEGEIAPQAGSAEASEGSEEAVKTEKSEQKKSDDSSLEDDDKEEDDANDYLEEEEEEEPTIDEIKSDVSFINQRRQLYNKLISLEVEERTKMRMDISAFYLFHRLFSESKGVLQDSIKLDPVHPDVQKMKATIGINLFLLGQYWEAEKVFKELKKSWRGSLTRPEIELWRWASSMKRQEGSSVNSYPDIPVDILTALDKFMINYPYYIKFEIGMLGVLYYIKQDQLTNAQILMETIADDDLMSAELENSKAFTQAKLAIAEGNIASAVSIYEKLMTEVFDRHNRARATLAYIRLKLNDGSMTKKEALNKLEHLGYVWRGDNLEIEIIKLLGKLYIDTGQYYKGLKAWQVIATYFPDSADGLLITGDMKDLFTDIFSEENLNKLDPLQALALYFEFRELTPVGERGDKILQRMVQYFVDADLMENAIDITKHQLSYRVKGSSSYPLSLKLANLYMENNQPDMVKEALRYINAAAPESIRLEAKYLQVSAYIAQGMLMKAQNVLFDDFSKEAESLRIEIFWNQQNWFGIMRIILPRLEEMRNFAARPLKSDELQDIFRLALAFKVQGMQKELDDLKEELEPRIPDGRMKRLFMYVADKNLNVDHSKLQETLQIFDIQSFVNSYSFLPGQQWQNITEILEPRVAKFTDNIAALSSNQRKDIIALALSYAKLGGEKVIDKKLEQLLRRFRKLSIDRFTIDVFTSLDDRFDPKQSRKTAFEKSVPISQIKEFIDTYENSHTIDELNSKIP